MQKKNLFIKKFKKLVLSITERIESFFNFFRVNIFHKKSFFKFLKALDKKIFIGVTAIFVTIISYFLLPAFYDEKKIKYQLEKQIFDHYNLKVKLDQNLKYGLFPKPHFLSKNTKIGYKLDNIAESNKTKIFISANNFFLLDKMMIKNLVFYKTDFKIESSNFKFFIDLLDNKKSNQKIDFLNSKFFYLDKNDDVVFLTTIKKLNYLYQENFITKLSSKLNIYNFATSLKIDHNILDKNFFIEAKSLPLRLSIKNNLNYNNHKFEGELNLSIINRYKKA